MTRRHALQFSAIGSLSYSRILGANDRLRGALVGCGNRGVDALLKGALAEPNVDIVAACDVYQPNLDQALTIAGARGGRVDSYTDYRKVAERKDIDIVFVATPDHWHAPVTIACCESGKDVYVEKPLANSIEDCLAVMDAATRLKRIVQVGVQQRSMKIYFDALDMIRQGRIGQMHRCVMVWGGDGAVPRQAPGEATPPDGLDWEMFQGPAPRRPYQPLRQRSWRSYWEYGSGVITDYGVHLLDVMHWFGGVDDPSTIFGVGYHSPGRPAEQVPDVVSLTWKYGGLLGTYGGYRDTWGNTFWGSLGSLHVNRSQIRLRVYDNKEEVVLRSQEGLGSEHIRNFLECVRSRNEPNAHAGIGCRSTVPCLLAAKSVRSGKPYRFDWTTRTVKEG